jgi:hypothetical protein
MSNGYEAWINDVQQALGSINMSMDDWQSRWPFDFQAEYKAGTKADGAAMKANRFWWHEQNKSLKQDCRSTPNCWLPRGHQGACQPVSPDSRLASSYERGDYVKVEFPDETTGIGEWMWVRVTRCDEQKKLVFGIHTAGVVVKPLSDASLCFKTCVILRADNTSRLIEEYVRMFLRKCASQRIPPKPIGLSMSARVVSLKKAIGPSRP